MAEFVVLMGSRITHLDASHNDFTGRQDHDWTEMDYDQDHGNDWTGKDALTHSLTHSDGPSVLFSRLHALSALTSLHLRGRMGFGFGL